MSNDTTVLKPGVYTIEGGIGSFEVPVKVTEAMIERAARALEQNLMASAGHSEDVARVVLRAALEVTDAT